MRLKGRPPRPPRLEAPGSRRPRGGSFLPAGALPLLAALALPSPLHCDGGTLRVANVPMGAYRVNIFTDPTPITPDTIDVSVLATFERGRGVATGLEVMVAARRTEGPGGWIRHPATREQATDPRYYSAKFSLGSVGDWQVVVTLKGPEGEGEVTFQVQVRRPGPFSNPVLILAAALLPLLLVGWWLRAGSRPPGPASEAPLRDPGQGR